MSIDHKKFHPTKNMMSRITDAKTGAEMLLPYLQATDWLIQNDFRHAERVSDAEHPDGVFEITDRLVNKDMEVMFTYLWLPVQY